ncbi:transposase [Streptomyces sp. NPDC086777]|uniref:transposase n=1 Tax=Streptomyces sp. NPDC086777 TaxID=3154866 RepID=UPI00344D9062
MPCRAGGKDVAVPKPYPEEFREDVVRVARNRGPGVTVEQVATDFAVHPMTLWKWMRRADIDEGTKPVVRDRRPSAAARTKRQPEPLGGWLGGAWLT